MGRMLAAINHSPNTAPVVQKDRLKREFPGAVARWHESLDPLESQLVCPIPHFADVQIRRLDD
jgi:hypothetical protein